MTPSHPVADLLRLLADCESSGSLHITGPLPGSFRLVRGTIVRIEVDGAPVTVPPDPGGSLPAPLVDAATVLIGRRTLAVPRFQPRPGGPGEPGREAPGCAVEGLLAAVERERERLHGCPLAPDDVLVLPSGPTQVGVRVEPDLWPLLGVLDQPRTVWQHAVRAGRRPVDVALALATLVEQGVAEVTPAGPGPLAGGTEDAVAQLVAEPYPVAARPAPVQTPAADPRPAPGRSAPLLHRRRPGATLPAQPPAPARTAGLVAPGAFEPTTPELLHRLLAGLHPL